MIHRFNENLFFTHHSELLKGQLYFSSRHTDVCDTAVYIHSKYDRSNRRVLTVCVQGQKEYIGKEDIVNNSLS